MTESSSKGELPTQTAELRCEAHGDFAAGFVACRSSNDGYPLTIAIGSSSERMSIQMGANGVHARIINMARAMCRSRRLDPDRPVSGPNSQIHSSAPILTAVLNSDVPAWMLFVDDAKRVLACSTDNSRSSDERGQDR